ncbi:MAG: excinuclease ABC subunit UvrC [Treponemataceae bacterium]|nr:MAG: excinuclease ABC subunit UvrC [Treponemataceae bacterium]
MLRHTQWQSLRKQTRGRTDAPLHFCAAVSYTIRMPKTTSLREQLHQTALNAPETSGVYLWRNSENIIIYIGKAKNLKNRLTSYFGIKKDIKTLLLVSNAASIEYITTNNELDSLILENNLIKQHNPRYNIDLKDDKSYPSIRITMTEDFPRVFRTRRILNDGSKYFGPYPNSGALSAFVEALMKIFPIRRCKRLHRRKAPCMYYHIKSCMAPCCGKISKKDYGAYITDICSILDSPSADSSGKNSAWVMRLTEMMHEAAHEQNFEKASAIRDGINAFAMLQNKTFMQEFDIDDRDYIAWHSEGEMVTFTVLKIRTGKLIGRDLYRTRSLSEAEELIQEFLLAYYTEKEMIPPKIFVNAGTGMTLMQEWFCKNFSCEPRIISPTENASDKRHIAALNMAAHNAKEDIVRRVRETGDIHAMQELQEILELPSLPVRIEGFDIAHLNGKFPVASLVSFLNGNPDKKNYRYFRLKTTDGIIDDFASMREASSRRYTRLLNEGKELPDLILIDGGIGQVNAVKGVLDALELDIPIAGLAKRDEEIFLPHNSTPLSIPKRSDALRLLQRVRDETHRFATSKNQALRTKENVG